jgi:hypothetical protein
MTTFCIAFDETYLSTGLPLDTFVLPLRVTTVGADAALLCRAAGTVLNAANYAPPALKISTKMTVKGMLADLDPHECWKLGIDPR